MKKRRFVLYVIAAITCFVCICICVIIGRNLDKRYSVQETGTNVNFDRLYVEKEHPIDFDKVKAENANDTNGHVKSQHIYAEMYQYAENTINGVKTVYFNPYFISGRLFITAKSVKLITNIQEMNTTIDGFCREARLYKDKNNQWHEGEKPPWILDDGSVKDGIYFILIDISIENDDAAIISQIDSYDDPYLFNASTLFSLFDMAAPAMSTGMYYFSGYGAAPQDEFMFHLEPGKTNDYVIGFVVEDEWLAQPSDLGQLYICNTQGIKNSVYIPLNLKVD